MKAFKIWLMATVFLGLSALLPAQTGTTNTELAGLITKALDNYPKLKEGNEYVRLGEARTDLAYGSYMPIINADASYRYAKPTPELVIPIPGFESAVQFIPANNYDFSLRLVQPIWDFGRTGAGIKKTKAETENARDNLESQKNTLAYQVAQLYYAIVFINKSMDVQQAQINLLGENEKLVNDKIKNGDALKFDLLSTQVKKNVAQNRLIDLQNQVHKQYDLLNLLTGNSGYDYITTKDAAAAPVNAETVTTDNNFDVRLLQDRLKTAEWDVKIAKRGWLPSLSLNAAAGYKNGYVPDINKITFNYGVGVGLNVPIFTSARPNFQTKIAKINLQANTYALEAQKLTLNKDIQQAKNDILADNQKLANYELQLKQADEALSLANVRYKGGVITSLELLTAQTNLQDAQLGKIQLEYNLLLAQLELGRLGAVKFW